MSKLEEVATLDLYGQPAFDRFIKHRHATKLCVTLEEDQDPFEVDDADVGSVAQTIIDAIFDQLPIVRKWSVPKKTRAKRAPKGTALFDTAALAAARDTKTNTANRVPVTGSSATVLKEVSRSDMTPFVRIVRVIAWVRPRRCRLICAPEDAGVLWRFRSVVPRVTWEAVPPLKWFTPIGSPCAAGSPSG